MASDDVVLGSTNRSKIIEPQGTAQRKVNSNALPTTTDKKPASAAPVASETISTSQSLNDHAFELTGLLDGIGQSVKILEAANKGALSLQAIVNEALSVAQKAGTEIIAAKKEQSKLNSDSEKTSKAALSFQELEKYALKFNGLRSQVDGIVKISEYRGVNLLNGDDLVTSFSKDGTNSVVTEGKNFSIDGLGIGVADFTNAKSIKLSIDQTNNALENIKSFESSISADLLNIQTRRDFAEQTIDTLKSGASKVTDDNAIDLNEEGAKLLALQTAQQLGEGDTSLSLATETQQSILRLF